MQADGAGPAMTGAAPFDSGPVDPVDPVESGPAGSAAPAPSVPVADWSDAYDNGGHIPGAADYPPRWAADAAAFRAALGPRARLDLPYPGPLADPGREAFDLFLPEGDPAGLVLFLHGGYWRAFGRETWSHLAAGAVARGWAVAMPSYTLAPAARIAGIGAQARAALIAAAEAVPGGPVAVAGHSAGGQLAARLLCADMDLPAPLRARIARAVAISGLFDLRPLLRTGLNDVLGLDAAEAAGESPAHLPPAPGARLLAWTGAAERPEYLRQARLIAAAWGAEAEVAAHLAPGAHHFDVIAPLAEPDSPLTRALLDW